LAGSETVYRGPAGMRRFWDEWHDVWDLTIEVSEVRDLGDTVVAMADVRTRGGVSGIDLERQLAFVFELEGGLARRVRSYFEPGEALEAVGLRDG
jgi:ketosteroid isomerase-like protein